MEGPSVCQRKESIFKMLPDSACLHSRFVGPLGDPVASPFLELSEMKTLGTHPKSAAGIPGTGPSARFLSPFEIRSVALLLTSLPGIPRGSHLVAPLFRPLLQLPFRGSWPRSTGQFRLQFSSLPEPFVPVVKFAYREGRSRVANYDVAIIGSGPGGYVAAIRAGELGLKTIVVEKDPFLGGTCLHVGCIPTKVLLHHADVYDHFKNAAELCFEIPGVKINWPNILARKSKIVTKHAKGIEFLFKKNKVEWVQGWGKYEGPGAISVEKNGKKSTIEARGILIVTGSEAKSLPGIEPDHKTIVTNRSILELPEIPKSLIVIGAGAVGVEFASIYNSFGAQVTILEALPRVVPVEDEEISAELEKAYKKKGITVQTNCMVESVKKDPKGVTVSFKDKDGKPQTLQAEKLLLAVGRKPMTENCGLEKSKAKIERGFVHVNQFME